jgi:HD superfamily phosphohydrolase
MSSYGHTPNKDNSNFQVDNSLNSNSNLSLIEFAGFNNSQNNYNIHFNSQIYSHSNLDTNSYKRTIFDSIHGHMTFDKYVWDIVDTVEFQRLRNLKQLGSVHFVYPGACHTRFEHSLGVAFYANKVISSLITQNSLENQIMLEATTLAGLCHDLGHGPFSHLFDRRVIKTLDPNCKWEHENASCLLLDYLIDKNHIDIDKDKQSLVKNLILSEYVEKYPKWLYQIVANKENSIDVDKFDYICRDSYNIGLQSSSVDFERIFSTAKIINDDLCFNIKNDFSISFLFHSRYKLFKQIYLHKTSMAIDCMMKDALVLSDKKFNFLECIYDPEKYIKLDDNIIHTIEAFSRFNKNDKNLIKAAEIVKNIKSRKLYKFVGEILVPASISPSLISIEDMISNDNPNNSITVNDIDMVNFNLDYGFGNINPMNNVKFYNSENLNRVLPAPPKISLLTPTVFKESYVRFFSKSEEKFKKIHEMFEKYIKKLDKNFNMNNSKNLYELTPEKTNQNKELLGSKRENPSEFCLQDDIEFKKKKIN